MQSESDRDQIGIRSESDRVKIGFALVLSTTMAQALQGYVSRHKGDVWNPPAWVFAPGVTMAIGKAAAFLGISAITLIRNTDNWGFTVYRTTGYRRYYLISELQAFKTDAPKLTASDIQRATKGGKNGLETVGQKAGKRKRTRD